MEALLSCSGPGAGAAIAESIRIGQSHASVAAGFVVVSLPVAVYSGRWSVPVVLLGLLALHPAWTVSAISGDCGEMKRVTARVVTALGAVALAWQVGPVLWAKRTTSSD